MKRAEYSLNIGWVSLNFDGNSMQNWTKRMLKILLSFFLFQWTCGSLKSSILKHHIETFSCVCVFFLKLIILMVKSFCISPSWTRNSCLISLSFSACVKKIESIWICKNFFYSEKSVFPQLNVNFMWIYCLGRLYSENGL